MFLRIGFEISLIFLLIIMLRFIGMILIFRILLILFRNIGFVVEFEVLMIGILIFILIVLI